MKLIINIEKWHAYAMTLIIVLFAGAFIASGAAPAGVSTHQTLFTDTIKGKASDNVAMIGNVGIGTSSPTTPLDVAGNAKAVRLISQGNTGTDLLVVRPGDDLNPGYSAITLGNAAWNAWPFQVLKNGNILTTGNIGIGVNPPTQRLEVAGTAKIGYLTVDPQDGVNEGGEVQLRGAGNNGGFQIDNYIGNARIHTLASGKSFQVLGGGIYAEGPIQSTSGGIRFPDGTVQNTASTNNALPAGVTIQGTAGRNYFRDTENAGDLRVGAAWGKPGIYAETGAGVLGGAGGASLQNDALFVKPDGSGVGIGTTNPGARLAVSTSDSQPMAYFEGKDLRAASQYSNNPDPSSYLFLKDRDSTELWGLRVGNAGDFAIHQAAVGDKVTITKTGNVGIGTTSPGAKLEVAGTIQSTSGGIRFPDGTVQNTASTNNALPAGVTIQGTAGRNYFRDTENAGDLRVGAAWGKPGIYAETGAGVLGGAGGASLQNDALFVKPDGSGVGIGTTNPAYKLDVNGDIISGWFRSRGQTGWYSQDYGGGWYMIDPWWIRSVGSKNVWVDQVIGSNAGLTVGYGGQGPPSTGAIIAGNVGIGTATPTQKLDVAGNVKTDGIVFADGTTQTTKAITGIWITPEGTHILGGTGCPSGYTQIASFADCGQANCYGNQLVCVKYG